jgi:ketopantoate hydroxymethyltransferase
MVAAAKAYAKDVREGRFPAAEQVPARSSLP